MAASVSANVLHARDNLISQIIAAWPPLALLATVELIAKIPIQQRFLGVVRVAATTCIAGIAAYAPGCTPVQPKDARFGREKRSVER